MARKATGPAGRAAAASRATLLLHEKLVLKDGAIAELVIWQLARPTAERPHGLTYRLYFGRGGKSLVRYDNETGKGDHRHVMDREEPYRFVSIARLREDFEADIRRIGGAHEKED
jgi:hypothetical protein